MTQVVAVVMSDSYAIEADTYSSNLQRSTITFKLRYGRTPLAYALRFAKRPISINYQSTYQRLGRAELEQQQVVW